VTTLGGSRVSNVRTNDAKRLNDVKVVKVPNPRGGRGGFTIVATARARIGDSGVIDGVRYVVRNEQQLRRLIRDRKWRDVERTCTSRITNMHGMFKYTGFNGNIGHWDMSKVTDMSNMFAGASAFNQDIGGWNVARVTNMREMFARARAFNQQIGGWNVARVTDISYMFYFTDAFNQPIAGWNVARVTNMGGTFYDARAFNQPIGRWNVARVTDMRRMFQNARAFRQDVSAWAARLPSNVRLDPDMAELIGDPPDPAIQAFRARRYRLHPEANAVDPVLMNRVPLNDARVIAGDIVHSRGNIRHIFHKNTLNGMLGASRGRPAKHPIARSMTFTKAHIVPLREVLHANDANLYMHIGEGKTVKQARNARNSRNSRP